MRRHVIAVALVAGFFGIRWILQPWLGASVPFLGLVPAIMLAAWFGGFGPGLLATALSGFVAAYFFLPPVGSFSLNDPADMIALPMFVAIGCAMSWLIESLHEAERAQHAAASQADARARQLQAVFEAIPDGVYVGTADGIQEVNSAGLRMLGAKSVEDLNARTKELSEKFDVRSTQTGQRIPVEDLRFSRALRGEVVADEVIARRADTGADVIIRGSAAPIRDAAGKVIGAVAINADVTEQHRAAERLAHANRALTGATERLQEVVSNVPGVVWEAWGAPDAATQRIDFVSDYLKEMLGYSAGEWTSVPNFWLTVVHPDDRERAAKEALAIFQSGRGGRSEFRWIHRDGHEVWVEAHSSVVLDEQGRPSGMRGVTLDITHRKKLERELAHLSERAEQARADAVKANRLKDDFLATLSHELRTPLNAILGYARMLHTGAVEPARQARAVEVIERNAAVLTQLVGDVLDVSRILTGKVRLNVNPVDLVAVTEQAIATVQPAADAKGVRIDVALDRAAGRVSGDADRLQQIVWNLLSNAVRFTPGGGGVQVTLSRVDSNVRIVVRDTGAGIDEAFLPHVFERFRQADSRFSREYGGLGLGLAISQELAELHGGIIEAASDGEGRGATFTVTLPLMAATKEPHAGAVQPAASGGLIDVDLRALQVLVVDDEADSLMLLQDSLEAAGAVVLTASTALEALDVLRVTTPHVVVTDLGMPGMDGFALLEGIRGSASPAIRAIPVAALTAYARSEDRTRTLKAGFQMHLAKPINPDELLAAVRSLARGTTLAS